MIVFDIFGVLTIDGWLKFCDSHFKDPQMREKAQELNRQTDAGRLDYDEFLKKISEISGISTTEIDAQLYERLPKNEQLFEFIRSDLKPRFKLAILSNIANANWIKEYFNAEELALFDDIVLSIEVGIIKPAPEIFEITAKRLGVKLSECAFVDDRLRNIEAAKQLGMKTIYYQNFPQFEADIRSYLNSSSKN